MKKISIFSILALVLFAVQGYAQQGPGPRGGRFNMEPKEMAAQQTEQMKKQLNLTDEQLPKIEALNLKYAEKMKAARDEAAGDRDAMRNTMRSMFNEKDTELQKILTEDQWATLQKVRQERRQNGRGRRGL